TIRRSAAISKSRPQIDSVGPLQAITLRTNRSDETAATPASQISRACSRSMNDLNTAAEVTKRHRACPGGSTAFALLQRLRRRMSSAKAIEPPGQARRHDVDSRPVAKS